ncbi:MAG: right-handed parallel beta-helix repeat-containing protein [Lachnospiraceae bacterium]|nr:right-handed parallel beta-helix repeat-containing protein [Lachnospiraceae bacterium]
MMKKAGIKRTIGLTLAGVLFASTILAHCDSSVLSLREVRATGTTAHIMTWNSTTKTAGLGDAVSFDTPITGNLSLLPSFDASVNEKSVYLAGDATVAGNGRGYTVESGKTLNIDLNGHSLSFAQGQGTPICIDGGTVNVFDSSTQKTGEFNGGNNTGEGNGTNQNGWGGCFRLLGSGTLNLYGVSISGMVSGSAYPVAQGGAIVINDSAGTVNAYDSNISGTSVNAAAGAVCVGVGSFNDGHFNMYKGKIYSSTSQEDGGGILVYGTAELHGVTINECSSTAGNGGAVRVKDGGDLTMEDGCAITGCTAQNGGGVYVENQGSVTLENSTISNCIASLKGGGIYVDNGGQFGNNDRHAGETQWYKQYYREYTGQCIF